MSTEKYIGEASITTLGNSEKLGAFLIVSVKDLLDGLAALTDEDEFEDVIKIKVVPSKSDPHIHKVKMTIPANYGTGD